MDRVRSRGIRHYVVQGSCTYLDPTHMYEGEGGCTGHQVLSHSELAFQPKRFGIMSDSIFSPGWNAVNHFKFSLMPYYPSIACPVGYSDYRSRPTVPEVLQLREQIPTDIVSDNEIANWMVHCYSDFSKQFPSHMSLANSLWELRHGLKEILPVMSDLRQNAGGNFLKIKFGIEPFIKDLMDACSVWSKFSKRLRFLRDHKGEVFKEARKKTKSLEYETLGLFEWEWEPALELLPTLPPPPPGIEQNKYQFVPHEAYTRYTQTGGEAIFTAHAIINNMIGDMDNLVEQADAFGRVVGLNNLPKIAWNAMPWTWLFDWGVDTDQILDQFDTDGPFQGKLNVEHFSLTMKAISQGVVETAHAHCAGAGWQGPADFAMRFYDRGCDVELGDEGSSLLQPSFNKGQAQILLALLISRSRRVPNWRRFDRLWKRFPNKMLTGNRWQQTFAKWLSMDLDQQWKKYRRLQNR